MTFSGFCQIPPFLHRWLSRRFSKWQKFLSTFFSQLWCATCNGIIAFTTNNFTCGIFWYFIIFYWLTACPSFSVLWFQKLVKIALILRIVMIFILDITSMNSNDSEFKRTSRPRYFMKDHWVWSSASLPFAGLDKAFAKMHGHKRIFSIFPPRGFDTDTILLTSDRFNFSKSWVVGLLTFI